MKTLFLSLCLGLLSLNSYSQSKLQGAGKASKIGATTTTTNKTPVTSTKPSTTKKHINPSNQVKRSPGSNYASKGYMEITGISFANTDANKTVVDNFDKKLYAKEVKYLTPRISYRGLASEEKEITLDIKLFDEEGNLKRGKNSPEGYTYSEDVTVEPGSGKYMRLPGWGNSKGGSYNAGIYKIELWYNNNMIYQKETRLYSGTTPIVSNNILSISSISFANTDKDANIINDYGQALYEGKVQYLKPKIYYNGKYPSEQDVTLYVRYFKSSGDLVCGSSSPTGFSYKESVTIKPGSNSLTLPGYGNESATNYKEGTCKVEVWIDGEKIYETNVNIKKPGSPSSDIGDNESLLKSIIDKPMGIEDCNSFTASFYTIKNKLSSVYSIDDSSTSDTDKLYIWGHQNNYAKVFTYRGLVFSYYLFSKFNDSKSLERRIKYKFKIANSQLLSLDKVYSIVNMIVKDFNNIGIPLSVEEKNKEPLKVEGSVRQGNVEYELDVEESTSNYEVAIDIWVYR